ncbi:hypothetical protein BT93_G0052 [Corymbia citriodora subsp. variegata]|nr:hypothetical protein BT93_G0052 [Corymbia citriodora subsp. variegata]
MAETSHSIIEDIFDDFNGRRSGILKALTTDKEAQCLVGHPNGTWEVVPPEMVVPGVIPKPVLGINFERFWKPQQEWAAMVADHSDSWLLAVALYFCVCTGFTKSEREMLFEKIHELPTVYETLQEFSKSNDQSGTAMVKLIISYGQSKFSETYVNSSVDDSREQKDDNGAAIEDGHNERSSSYGQSESSGTRE